MQHPSLFCHRSSHIQTNGNGGITITTAFALLVTQYVSHKYIFLPHTRK